MSQITKTSLALALGMLGFCGVLSVAGCGDENSRSYYDPDQGAHPQFWLPTGHIQPALDHLDTCTDCHGSRGEQGIGVQNGEVGNPVPTTLNTGNLSGGISKVPCSRCHTVSYTAAGNAAVHPQDWDGFVYARHAAYVHQKGAGNCQSSFCHGTNLQGGPGPSCTSCHIGGVFQVHPWASQQQDLAATPPLHAQYIFVHGNTTASCRNIVCHGANLQGVLLSGPACSACHGGAAAFFPQ